jgi:membrane-associated protein
MLYELLHLLEPMFLIKTLGTVGVFAIIFAESGLLFGFFLPGDSLLFTAGFLASLDYLDITVLLWGSFFFAVLGDSVGYWFGRKFGPKIFKREDSFFFHRKHLERARNFYSLHGNKTIFLARFIPIIRTFAPIVAGIGSMKYKDFIFYNVFGGFVWTFGMISSGYFLGQLIPNADTYILPIIIIIIIISFLPIVREVWKHKKGL